MDPCVEDRERMLHKMFRTHEKVYYFLYSAKVHQAALLTIHLHILIKHVVHKIVSAQFHVSNINSIYTTIATVSTDRFSI